MTVSSIAELKTAISKHWKSVPAGTAALKVISAIELNGASQTRWSLVDILGLLGGPALTPDAVGALAILTQSEYAIFRVCGEFVDEDNQRHALSSEDFQRVLDEDTLQHPVTGVVVTQASERVLTFFAVESSLFA